MVSREQKQEEEDVKVITGPSLCTVCQIFQSLYYKV